MGRWALLALIVAPLGCGRPTPVVASEAPGRVAEVPREFAFLLELDAEPSASHYVPDPTPVVGMRRDGTCEAFRSVGSRDLLVFEFAETEARLRALLRKELPERAGWRLEAGVYSRKSGPGKSSVWTSRNTRAGTWSVFCRYNDTVRRERVY